MNNQNLKVVLIADKMRRCHKAAKALLGSQWKDNFNQWKALIDMHQKMHPGQPVMESVLFIAKSIEGAEYSTMVLMAVAYEIISTDENGE